MHILMIAHIIIKFIDYNLQKLINAVKKQLTKSQNNPKLDLGFA